MIPEMRGCTAGQLRRRRVTMLTTIVAAAVAAATFLAVSIDEPNGTLSKWFHTASTTRESQHFDGVDTDVSRSATTAKLVGFVSDFEEWDHRVPETVASLAAISTIDTVVILAERRVPYPPIYPPGRESPPNVIIIPSRDNPGAISPQNFQHRKSISTPHHRLTRIRTSSSGLQVLNEALIGADAVFFTTDSSRVPVDSGSLQTARTYAVEHTEAVLLVSSPRMGSPPSQCYNATFDVRRWTLVLAPAQALSACNYIEGGSHGILVLPRSVLKRVGDWHLTRPLIEATLLKLHAIGIRITALPVLAHIQPAPSLYVSPHNEAKRLRAVAGRRAELYTTVGIKLKTWQPGKQEWHGCSREGPRCFGTVFNDRPDFIEGGRWTPPCCLVHLRETAHYVFGKFDAAGIRWWLEGGSLLGAVRNGDLIPWDYDVDVGIRREDIGKCLELTALETTTHHVTPEGYVWERAREGGFYRVQFSAYNHLHVDIFPFHVNNDLVVKGQWNTGHKQDTSFPSSFLEPLGRLPFGSQYNASVPGKPREFLEYKFGEGVIEHPMYS